MISGKSVLAIIPAREGSKRIPLKNLTLFRGKTLVEWAIHHAQNSRYIDQILISSDSENILTLAKPPIIRLHRPEYLASDFATSEALIAHALYSLETLPDFFVLLQPTSPLRASVDIDTCIERSAAPNSRLQCISFDPYGKRNGAVYASSSPLFLSILNLQNPLTGAELYEMPLDRSLDINYPQDLLPPHNSPDGR